MVRRKHRLHDQPLNRENESVVCHFIRMLFCEGGQVRVCRIAFMSDMRCKGWAMGS